MPDRSDFSADLFGTVKTPSVDQRVAIRFGYADEAITGGSGMCRVDGVDTKVTAAVPVDITKDHRVVIFFIGNRAYAIPVGTDEITVNFAWASKSVFPGKTDPMYSKPEDNIAYAVWDAYALPESIKVDSSGEVTLPEIKNATRYTWGGMAWLTYSAHCWFSEDVSDASAAKYGLPGAKVNVDGSITLYALVTKSRYDGGVG